MPVAAEAPSAFEVRAPKSEFPFWKWPVSIGLATVLLYFALRGVDWRQAWIILSHCRLKYLALACACSALSYVVRAMRWRLLLTAQEKLAPATVLWASSVGYLANAYLPARAGAHPRLHGLVRPALPDGRRHRLTLYA